MAIQGVWWVYLCLWAPQLVRKLLQCILHCHFECLLWSCTQHPCQCSCSMPSSTIGPLVRAATTRQRLQRHVSRPVHWWSQRKRTIQVVLAGTRNCMQSAKFQKAHQPMGCLVDRGARVELQLSSGKRTWSSSTRCKPHRRPWFASSEPSNHG